MSEAPACLLFRRQEMSMGETRGIIRGFEQKAESPKPPNNSSPLLLEGVKLYFQSISGRASKKLLTDKM